VSHLPFATVGAVTDDKKQVLRNVQLGGRIAEEEAEHLAAYFVETEQWRRVWAGEVDVVYGPKGSGKSAIYSTLIAREDELFDRDILVAPAVNPRGSGAFEGLVEDPPTTEGEFVGLWKIYFLLLIAEKLDDYSLNSEPAAKLIEILTDAKLREAPHNLRALLSAARTYVRRLLRATELEPTVKVDSATGAVTFSTRIKFEEPSVAERAAGAFEGSSELETNALRALFRVYLDLMPYRNLALKIFLRTDIWRSITAQGFREASHITRDLTLAWDRPSLLRLVVQRLLQNESVRTYYGLDQESVLGSISEQQKFYELTYPLQVESGPKKSRTFDWCMRRTQDGTGQTAPRELIHLLTGARDVQLRLLELGSPSPAGTYLFSAQSLKDALPEVSEARLTRTMYAEFTDMKTYMEMLRGAKTNHNVVSLASAWGKPGDESREIADRLVEIGFFERRKSESGEILYWVPFLYRPALEMVQGSADSVGGSPRDDDDEAA
jgi:hypothetical protein